MRFYAGYVAIPAGPSAQPEFNATSTVTLGTQQGLQPPPSLILSPAPQLGYAALLVSWAGVAGALIWRGHVRSVWGQSRFSYDTFRLLVKMRGAQTRLKLMRSLSEPKNKLQLATALGIDWKAVDKHVQMLEKGGLIHPTVSKGTATWYELTEKGSRLLELLVELTADTGEINQP